MMLPRYEPPDLLKRVKGEHVIADLGCKGLEWYTPPAAD